MRLERSIGCQSVCDVFVSSFADYCFSIRDAVSAWSDFVFPWSDRVLKVGAEVIHVHRLKGLPASYPSAMKLQGAFAAFVSMRAALPIGWSGVSAA